MYCLTSWDIHGCIESIKRAKVDQGLLNMYIYWAVIHCSIAVL